MSDERHLELAVRLAARCPPSATAFSVGAVLAEPGGEPLATGYSRADDPRDHAEEVALRRASGDLSRMTMYSSLEPCGRRASRPRTCAELIIAAGIRRVVYALAEPPLFVAATGAALLRAAGVAVVHLTGLEEAAREPNRHLHADPRSNP